MARTFSDDSLPSSLRLRIYHSTATVASQFGSSENAKYQINVRRIGKKD